MIYIVKEGETLLGLSDRLQVALEDLLQMNALTTDSVLLAGQVLIIGYQPAPDASGGSVDLPQPTASPTPIFAPTLSPTLAPPTLPPPTVASATELANVPAVFASATPAPRPGRPPLPTTPWPYPCWPVAYCCSWPRRALGFIFCASGERVMGCRSERVMGSGRTCSANAPCASRTNQRRLNSLAQGTAANNL